MSQTIQFVKMHGLGNDFLVIDGINQNVQLSPAIIRQWSHRHAGIGFDQLLLIEKSNTADFFCRIFNSDGSEAEQCGNGMRCVARFLIEENLTKHKSIQIETKSGIVRANAHDFDHIEVEMGIPVFDPTGNTMEIPFFGSMDMTVVSMGNPHVIFFVDTLENFPVQEVGFFITTHKTFPQGVNAGFVEMIDHGHIRLRTFERGVGPTLACGSNACAAVAAGIMNHKLADTVTVELELGQLTIQWKGNNHPVIMIGPASRVYSGLLPIPAKAGIHFAGIASKKTR